MPTQLDPEQISGLTSSISNLETADSDLDFRITLEDSINDAVDASLAARISLEDSINDEVDASLASQVSALQQLILSSGGGSGLNAIQDIYDGTIVTETMSETISKTMPIPSNTFAEGNIIDLVVRVKKNTTTAPVMVSAYISQSQTLYGQSDRVFQANMGSFERFIQISRLLTIRINSFETELFDPLFPSTTDMTTTSKTGKLQIDWQSDNYLIVTVQNNSMTEESVVSLCRIFST